MGNFEKVVVVLICILVLLAAILTWAVVRPTIIDQRIIGNLFNTVTNQRGAIQRHDRDIISLRGEVDRLRSEKGGK